MWTVESEYFLIRWRQKIGACVYRTNLIMAADRRQIAFVLLRLISSPLACMQLIVALLNAEISYARRRLDICKLFTLSTGQNGRQKQLKRAGKQCLPRRFWVRPGRTSAWWDNFVNQIVIAEEWRENFRISRGSLYELANELRPYIEGKTTVMNPKWIRIRVDGRIRFEYAVIT